MKQFILILLPLIAFIAQADGDRLSAYRDPKLPYTFYEERALLDAPDIINASVAGRTPLRNAKFYEGEDLDPVTRWASLEVLHERFEQVRDARFLVSNNNENFPRRSTWLYPDDGCYARAALANRNIFRWYYPLPNKVFVFGNLKVKTQYSPRGFVTWWYHVAPIVEVKGLKYVLDPAIEASRPLPLKDWLSRMGRPEKIKVAICSSGTYAPSDECLKQTDGMELKAEDAQKHFLSLEWARLKRLGRDAERELGEDPPWPME